MGYQQPKGYAHGRTSFDPGVGGRRHMQGCYADRDSLDSKIRVLAKELNLNLLTRHVLEARSLRGDTTAPFLGPMSLRMRRFPD